jgi:adenylate cyclase
MVQRTREESVMAASAIKYSMTMEIDSSIERLWPLLSDTDRTNRMLGLPSSDQVTPNPDLSRTISGRFVGVPVSWKEYPFEWVSEQWFEITRVFEPPFPVDRLTTRTILTARAPNTTHIEVQVEQTARSSLGGQPARLFVEQKFLRDMRRVYGILGKIAAEMTEYVPPPPLRAPTVNQGRLDQATQRMRQSGVHPALIAKLEQHLRSADDPDVIKMRPFVLADRWGEPRLDVLRMFLYGTRGGLLDLEWDIICPNCRGASARLNRLADVAGEAHCPSCQIRYDVDFEESVELRFSVSPDIRQADDSTYCVGGPANTRHILTQIWVEAKSVREIQLRLGEGAYRLRSKQLGSRALIEVNPAIETRDAMIFLDTHEIVAPGGALSPGVATLTFRNLTEQRVLIILEQSAWNLQAASASLVTALDEFRQLFSSEVLAPGLGISIRNLTFMFSDLKDSTQIYDMIGDSPAYARVRDHFDIMRNIIATRNGALVKTIGDAVMAVFRSPEDAIEASILIQQEFAVGPIAQVNPTLRVKLGIHRGPCIAVNANELLDYFGSTVNIAARVQSESVGGDIVVTDELLEDPGVQQVVARERMTAEQFERSLKGFSRSFTLTRFWLPAAQPVAPAVTSGQPVGRLPA